MFRKTFAVETRQALGAREAKTLADAFVRGDAFPFLRDMLATCGGSNECRDTLVSVLTHITGVVIDAKVEASIAVASVSPLLVDPDSGLDTAFNGAALLFIGDVPIAFMPLKQAEASQAAAGSASAKAPSGKGGASGAKSVPAGPSGKGGKTAPAPESKTQKLVTAVSLIQSGAAATGPWLPTLFAVYRVHATLQRLSLLASCLKCEDASRTGEGAGLLALLKLACAGLEPATAKRSVLPPFQALPLLGGVASMSIGYRATPNILGGADAMAAGMVEFTPRASLLRAYGNSVPFAVGLGATSESSRRSMRVLHTHGDGLYTTFFAAYSSDSQRRDLWLVSEPIPPYCVAVLNGTAPPPRRGVALTTQQAQSSSDVGQQQSNAQVASDEEAEETGKTKKKKHVPAKYQQAQQTAEKPKKGATAPAASSSNATDDIGSLTAALGLTETMQRAAPFITTALHPAGFGGDAVRSLEPLYLHLRRLDHQSAAAAAAAADGGSHNPDDGDAASVSDEASTEGDDGDEEESAVRSDDGSDAETEAGGAALEGVTEKTTIDQEFPLTPEEAVVFAVCEALRRLSTADLPMSLATFVPNFVMTCMPPTYVAPPFDWTWCAEKKPLPTLEAHCSGLLTIAPRGDSSEGGAAYAVMAFDKKHPIYRQHRRRYHASGALSRNGVVLAIDGGAGSGSGVYSSRGSREEAAAAVCARRIVAVGHAFTVKAELPESVVELGDFVPAEGAPGRLGDLKLSPMRLQSLAQSEEEVDLGELRQHLKAYSIVHGLVVRPTDADVGKLNAANEKVVSGHIRLDTTLRFLCKRDGAAAADVPVTATPAEIIRGITRFFRKSLKIEFAGGTCLHHFATERWGVRLEQHLVRNHWQTKCFGMQHFGVDTTGCKEVWPSLFACSVELEDDSFGKPTVVVVHGRLRNRITNLLTNVVGIPAKNIHFGGREK